MKKAIFVMLLVLALLLTGCSWMDGSYISVTPHREQDTFTNQRIVSASNYGELRTALEKMIQSGMESTVINVVQYDQSLISNAIKTAVRYVQDTFPLGAYAVDEITYEVGTNAGRPAIAVNITYLHSRIDIQKVRTVGTMDEAFAAITAALDNCDPNIVLLVERYSEMDLAQLVADHAAENPQSVMELPQVSAAVYPENGVSRVIELTFSYENSRENLRLMQNQVAPVFASAALYVSGDGSDYQKYSQLYAFLMERFDYEITTSITPAYSLLRHGVGDNRAFATVFAAMCRRAGLDCQVVTGTRDGVPWNWNIVKDGENYLHVDLIRCSQTGGFRECSDVEMTGYVWDYSAYPVCTHPEAQRPPEEQPTAPQESTAPTGETNPEK